MRYGNYCQDQYIFGFHVRVLYLLFYGGTFRVKAPSIAATMANGKAFAQKSNTTPSNGPCWATS
jgi:hypothetical protein